MRLVRPIRIRLWGLIGLLVASVTLSAPDDGPKRKSIHIDSPGSYEAFRPVLQAFHRWLYEFDDASVQTRKVLRQFSFLKNDRRYVANVVLPVSLIFGEHGVSDWLQQSTHVYESAAEMLIGYARAFPEIGTDMRLIEFTRAIREDAQSVIDYSLTTSHGLVESIYRQRAEWLMQWYRTKGLFRHDADGRMEKEISAEMHALEHDTSAMVVIFAEGRPEEILATATVRYLTSEQSEFDFEKRFGDSFRLSRAREETHTVPMTLWIPEGDAFSDGRFHFERREVEGDASGWAEIKAIGNFRDRDVSLFPELIALMEGNKLLSASPEVSSLSLDSAHQEIGPNASVKSRTRGQALDQGLVFEQFQAAGLERPLLQKISSNKLIGHLVLDFDEASDQEDQGLRSLYRRWGFQIEHSRINPWMPQSVNHVAYASRESLVKNLIESQVESRAESLRQTTVRFENGTLLFPQAKGIGGYLEELERYLERLREFRSTPAAIPMAAVWAARQKVYNDLAPEIKKTERFFEQSQGRVVDCQTLFRGLLAITERLPQHRRRSGLE